MGRRTPPTRHRTALSARPSPGDPTGARPPTAVDDPPPAHGGWELINRLVDGIDSGEWTWAKSLHVAFLCTVLVVPVGGLAWAVQQWTDLPGWAVGLGAGISGTSVVAESLRRHRRQRR